MTNAQQADLDLDLAFTARLGSAVFARNRYRWPNVVSRLFRVDQSQQPAGFVILQGAGASLQSGDRFQSRIVVDGGVHIEVRGQGAMLVASVEESGPAHELAWLEATADSFLVYRQEPRILRSFGALEQRLEIELDEGSTVLACESAVVHPETDPDRFGSYHATVSVHRRGSEQPHFLETQSLVGGQGPLRPYRAFGSVYVAVYAPRDHLDRLCAALSVLEREHDGSRGAYAAVSELPNACGVSVRIAAVDGFFLRAAIDHAMCLASAALSLHLPDMRTSEPLLPTGSTGRVTRAFV